MAAAGGTRGSAMTSDVELSDEERQSLAALKRDAAPPSHLVDQIVSTLRSRGLIRAPMPALRWMTAAAALLLAFGAGAWSQRRSPVAVHPAQPRFVLLL